MTETKGKTLVGKAWRGVGLSAVAITATALVLGGCSAKKTPAASAPSSQAAAAQSSVTPTPTPVIPATELTMSPAAASTGISPVQPVKVSVANGTLSAVTMRSATGTVVVGALAADKSSWTSTTDLGYSKTYTVDATAVDGAGKPTSKHMSFTTVTPNNQTMAYINTGAGQSISPGVTYGVGQVVKIHFDEPIPDKKAAEAALKVQTTPAQPGSFNWFDDQDVYWRSRIYLKPGTQVTITSKIYGKTFGGGLYGQADSTTWFKVGDSHISIADDNTKMINVYTNGKLVKQMPTSMGRHTSIPGDHGLIDLRTNSGPHVVIDAEHNINMASCSFGLCKGANSYKVIVPVGVKISYDGEYVHWADWSVWAQGNTDTSHGCLNVSPANSYWFAAYSLPGDIVDVENTGRPLALSNSGYWTESWAQWAAGSAL